MSVSTEEREKLFRQFRHSVGAPIRQIELTDEQLCTLLEISIEDQDYFNQLYWRNNSKSYPLCICIKKEKLFMESFKIRIFNCKSII
jgi:hypothetical protein